jgi:hypothetical protein
MGNTLFMYLGDSPASVEIPSTVTPRSCTGALHFVPRVPRMITDEELAYMASVNAEPLRNGCKGATLVTSDPRLQRSSVNGDVLRSIGVGTRYNSFGGLEGNLNKATQPLVIFDLGEWTDGTHTFGLEHSADGQSYSDVSAELMTGTPPVVDGAPDDNTVASVLYNGTYQYLRAVCDITDSPGTGLNAGAIIVCNVHNVEAVGAIVLGPHTAAVTSSAIDIGTSEQAMVIFDVGVWTESIHVFHVQHALSSSGPWEDVPDTMLHGTIPTIEDGDDDAQVYCVAYSGPNRYLRVVSDVIGDTETGAIYGVLIVRAKTS